jgi:murein DD-endopeptidase MepM/ murein hydrolase activator NlpD
MVRGARKKSGLSKWKWLLIIIFFVGLGYLFKFSFSYLQRPSEETQAEVVAVEEPEYKPFTIEADITYTVQEGDVLSDIFSGYEIPFSEIVALEKTESDIFAFTKVQVGKNVHFSLHDQSSDFRLAEVIYQPDLDRLVKATQTHAGWVIEEELIQYDLRQTSATGSVDASFYVAGLDAGLDDRAILAFADVFAWDIDFVRQTRKGDTFKLLYEAKYLGGELISSGRILAAEYINAGTEYQVFFYKGSEEETGSYYTAEGESVQKSFLRVPTNFRYVSSGFTNARFHPITKTVMPHNGVDYPAAAGTPILAIGDGVVTSRGYQGAYGNRIEIRHSGVHASQYAHLSAFGNYAVGQKVKQGDLIGYVGSTGFSTGPHLHFSMTKHGQYVDPSSVEAPAGDPVAEQYKEDYLKKAAELKIQLDAL